MYCIHRYHDMQNAQMIQRMTQPLTNVRLCVINLPVDDARQDKAGPWAICSEDKLNTFDNNKLSDALRMGTQLALADALRAVQPTHKLCNIWHLRPENRHVLHGQYNIKQTL